MKIKRTAQLVARDVPYIVQPKKALQTLRQRYGVSDHRDLASSHLFEQFKTNSIEFPYVRANDIEDGRVVVLLSTAQYYAVDSKGTVRSFLPSILEFKVRHLLGQPRKENVHQEQAYFAEVKALLEDQYPMSLETAKVAEKPKAMTESTSFVNKSPNTQALKAAQTSAQDYWEGMADSAVEEGGVLGFPKYLGSKAMGALANVGHGVIQSVGDLSNSKGVQEGPELSAQDAKAVEALNEANPQSIKDNLEYGGFIYQNPNGTYDYTTPLQGADKSFDLTAAEDLVPKGSVIVGNYHTHGDYSIYDQETGAFIRTGDPARDDLNSDNFSSGDIRVCTINAERGYLGTPSGVFRAYDPIEKRDYVIKP